MIKSRLPSMRGTQAACCRHIWNFCALLAKFDLQYSVACVSIEGDHHSYHLLQLVHINLPTMPTCWR